jgi:chromosome segregation ATPase
MSNKLKAAEEIKKLGRSLKGFIAFAEELEQMGSLEQAAKELDQAFERAKDKKEKAEFELGEVQKQSEHAQDFAEAVVAGAKAEAMQKVEEAKAEATAILAKAHSAIDKAMEEFKEQKALAYKELKEVKEQVEKAKTELAEAQSGLDEAKKQVAVLRSKLA